jgi:hypothetical protein
VPDNRPSKPFNRCADPDCDQIRDKDNAKPKLQPKHLRIKPAPNLAPSGMSGIKQGLPSNSSQEKGKRFSIKQSGDLSKKFNSIAPKSPKKGPDWER